MRLFSLVNFMLFAALSTALEVVPARADSVTFRASDVHGTFRTKGVEIHRVQGSLDCRFIDDNGAEVLHPKEQLKTDWTTAPTTATDFVYFDLTIHGGKLWDFKFFSTLASCAYRLSFAGIDPRDGSAHQGELILAGSQWNMPQSDLSQLLSNPDELAQQIARKVRLLTVYINQQSGEISAVSQ